MKSYNPPNKFVQIIFLLLCLGSVAWLGSNLAILYFQIRQFKQANSLLSQQKYSSAIAAYDQLLQAKVKQRHLLWINRGYAFSGLERYQDMLESCSTATLVNPQAALGWNCQGEALYYLERYSAALTALDKATDINLREATFWLNKSRVLSVLQEYDRAIAASQKAIKLNAKSPLKNKANRRNLAIAHNQVGQSLLKVNRYQPALKSFEQSLEYFPNYLSAQQGKGIALYQIEYYKRAIETFEQILQRDDLTQEQRALSWLYKGISFCQIENLTAANQAFQRVLQLTESAKSINIAKAGCGIQ